MDQPIRESGPHLAGLLGSELGPDDDGPLYLRISDGLKRLVDRGDVPAVHEALQAVGDTQVERPVVLALELGEQEPGQMRATLSDWLVQ